MDHAKLASIESNGDLVNALYAKKFVYFDRYWDTVGQCRTKISTGISMERSFDGREWKGIFYICEFGTSSGDRAGFHLVDSKCIEYIQRDSITLCVCSGNRKVKANRKESEEDWSVVVHMDIYSAEGAITIWLEVFVMFPELAVLL